MQLKNEMYYFLKPMIPRNVQVFLRRIYVRMQVNQHKDVWPINPDAIREGKPTLSWPDEKKFAFILTHDVESERGVERCLLLAELEKARGLRSSFNFVPEGYVVPASLRDELTRQGFEVGVHGLTHDGKLYESEATFRARAKKINQYLSDWGAVGFRSPAMHHNLDWIGLLDIEYDASTFDTDPFEPQSDGVASIVPFWVNSALTGKGYVELPYTLPQDFTLFVLIEEQTPEIWSRKLDWIAENRGMALLNVHPDYLNDGKNGRAVDEFPASLYEDFLDDVLERYAGQFWHALPREVARYSRVMLHQDDENVVLLTQNS